MKFTLKELRLLKRELSAAREFAEHDADTPHARERLFLIDSVWGKVSNEIERREILLEKGKE